MTRVLKDFVIEEISAVDRPAQEGARVVIMKSIGDDKAASVQLLAVSGNPFLATNSAAAATSDLTTGTLRVYSNASVTMAPATGGETGKLWEVLSKAAGNSAAKIEYDPQLVQSLGSEALKSGDPAAGATRFSGGYCAEKRRPLRRPSGSTPLRARTGQDPSGVQQPAWP